MTDINEELKDNELLEKIKSLGSYDTKYPISVGDVVMTGGGGGGGSSSWSSWGTMPSPTTVITTSSTTGSYTGGTVTVGGGGTGQVLSTGTTGINNSGIMWTGPTGGTTMWSGPTGGTGGLGRQHGSFTYQAPTTTCITLGPKFKITAPTDGNSGPVEIEYDGQKLDVGELFSMVSVFKVLLKTVATDKDFCKRHPEITDMAHAYLLEELKR